MKQELHAEDLFSLVGPKVGDRVRVNPLVTEDYAVGAADSLSGQRGVVEERKDVDHYGVRLREPRVLVRFAEPASPWWTNQLPVASFWFDASEVEAA